MPLVFDNETVERVSAHIAKAKKIVLIAHMNPDGDAVGSTLGCYNWLHDSFFVGSAMPQVCVMLPHALPPDMSYLPHSDIVIDAESNLELCVNMLGSADLIWCLDFNKANRVQPLDKALTDSKAVKIVVDHHHEPDLEFFDEVISAPDVSATCEMLYWLFVQAIGDSSVSDNTARCLYHGMLTDTGGFSYSNEQPSLYEATAALMRHPLNAADVHNRVANNYPIAKMRLLGFLISQRLKVFEDEGFAYMYCTAEDMRQLGVTPYALEGLVNYTLMMEPITVGAMVKEAEGKVRLSFRSKYDFDVNSFAQKYFGGGGHRRASGATSEFPMTETCALLEKNMLQEIALLRKSSSKNK